MGVKVKKTLPLPVAFACNIALLYLLFMLCRVVFVVVNSGLYADSIANNSFGELLRGSLLFDTSAICYLTLPYILTLLLPLHYKESAFTRRLAKFFYVAAAAIGIIANFADTVYVPFTGRRSTWSVFTEFSNEGNIVQVVGIELLNHWYLTIGAIALIYILCRLYREAEPFDAGRMKRYYITRTAMLLVVAPMVVFGIRGGIGSAVRPITISNANQYVNSPSETAIVLNTPFSMIRTIGKSPFKEKDFFPADELDAIYTPLHTPQPDAVPMKKNVVIFILESFG